MRGLIHSSLVVSLLGGAFATARAGDISNRPTLTLDGAKSVAASAIRYAQAHGAPGAAIAIVDAGGILLYVERVDRAPRRRRT